MMKIIRQISDTCTLEADGQTVAEVHENISLLEEIFSIDTCGVCGHKGVRYQVRTDDEKHKYHMAVCANTECKAEFRFGLMDGGKGVLFPQRKFPTKGNPKHPRAGEWKPDGGWAIWKPSGDSDGPPPARPAPVPPRPADPRPQPQPAKVLSPAELAANLDGYDLKLSGEGLFPKGALVDAVVDACAKMGFPADPLRWAGPEAQAVARKATQAFVERARAAKK